MIITAHNQSRKMAFLAKNAFALRCYIKNDGSKTQAEDDKAQDNHRKSNKFVKSYEVSLGFTDSSVVAAASPSRALPAKEIALLKIA